MKLWFVEVMPFVDVVVPVGRSDIFGSGFAGVSVCVDETERGCEVFQLSNGVELRIATFPGVLQEGEDVAESVRAHMEDGDDGGEGGEGLHQICPRLQTH